MRTHACTNGCTHQVIFLMHQRIAGSLELTYCEREKGKEKMKERGRKEERKRENERASEGKREKEREREGKRGKEREKEC